MLTGKIRKKSIIDLSLIHISEPTRRTPITYAVFCLEKDYIKSSKNDNPKLLLKNMIFLMIRRPPRSTRKESSAASDVYKRQIKSCEVEQLGFAISEGFSNKSIIDLSLIHISEPTRRTPISYAVFCLKKSDRVCHGPVSR